MRSVCKLIFLSSFLCFACSDKSQSVYRSKGEKISSRLASCLEKVENVEDLKNISPKLKKKFMQLTNLMIEAKRKQSQSGFSTKMIESNHLASDRLLYELHRLSKDPECLKLLKTLQRDSLEKLDTVASKNKKKSNY